MKNPYVIHIKDIFNNLTDTVWSAIRESSIRFGQSSIASRKLQKLCDMLFPIFDV